VYSREGKEEEENMFHSRPLTNLSSKDTGLEWKLLFLLSFPSLVEEWRGRLSFPSSFSSSSSFFSSTPDGYTNKRLRDVRVLHSRSYIIGGARNRTGWQERCCTAAQSRNRLWCFGAAAVSPFFHLYNCSWVYARIINAREQLQEGENHSLPCVSPLPNQQMAR